MGDSSITKRQGRRASEAPPGQQTSGVRPATGARSEAFGAAAAVLSVPARQEIVAVAEFLELAASGRLHAARLVAWAEQHDVVLEVDGGPSAAREHGAPAVRLREATADDEARLEDIVRAARGRVVEALRGLLGEPCRDGFVVAALAYGRVRRVSLSAAYVPSLKGDEPLGDVVLALVAADILGHREEYDRDLRVCDACGRIALAGPSTTRRSCFLHS